jgi:hypothetical protein
LHKYKIFIRKIIEQKDNVEEMPEEEMLQKKQKMN